MLHHLGYQGDENEVILQVKKNELLLRNLMSASAMWVANAATVSPSLDTFDKKLHLTTANLANGFHRAIEARQTTKVLQRIFNDQHFFQIHPAIKGGSELGDEGAANHGRLCRQHGQPGVEIFVYGRNAFDSINHKFPRRQTREASEIVARLHGLSLRQCIFIQQGEEAINAGVFHNDVISVINENVFLFHEKAFEDKNQLTEKISEKCDFDATFLEISEQELPLVDAVSSYLFNSQLLTLSNGNMALLLPIETQENPNALACVNRLINDNNNPIEYAYFMDLRQSMSNGGGPACLRLRIVLTPQETKALSGTTIVNHKMLSTLESIIKKYYRTELSPADLSDSDFFRSNQFALDEISKCLSLEGIYDFQQ